MAEAGSEVQHADETFEDKGQGSALEECFHLFKQEVWRTFPIDILNFLGGVYSPCHKRLVCTGKLVHS